MLFEVISLKHLAAEPLGLLVTFGVVFSSKMVYNSQYRAHSLEEVRCNLRNIKSKYETECVVLRKLSCQKLRFRPRKRCQSRVTFRESAY